jgi:hypothetical protein
LVGALDSLFETGLGLRRMRPRVECSAISIGQDPTRVSSERMRIKLFFEHEADDATEAECFLLIDVPAGRIELREKDSDYRAQLVKALGM